MKNILDYLIVFFLFMIILFAVLKRIDVFKSFVEGVKDGFRILIRIFFNVFVLIVVVEFFIKIGVLDIL